MKNLGGRPTKYKSDFHPSDFIRLSKLGKTLMQIAFEWDVDRDTINEWGKKHAPFSVAIKKGREFAEGYYANLGHIAMLGEARDKTGKKLNVNLDHNGIEMNLKYRETRHQSGYLTSMPMIIFSKNGKSESVTGGNLDELYEIIRHCHSRIFYQLCEYPMQAPERFPIAPPEIRDELRMIQPVPTPSKGKSVSWL